MIKRDFPLTKVPLDERPYDATSRWALRADGTPKTRWRYRNIEIQEAIGRCRGYEMRLPRHRYDELSDTLSEACDRVDSYHRRREGQLRRIARDLAASVAHPVEAEPVDNDEGAEQPIMPLPTDGVFVDALGFSIGPVTVRNLIQRPLIEMHALGLEGSIGGPGYGDMADELVKALAQAGFEIVRTAPLPAAA